MNAPPVVRPIVREHPGRLLLVARTELSRRLRQPLWHWTVAAFGVIACISITVGSRDLALRRDVTGRQIAELAATQVRSPNQLMGWEPEASLRVIRPPQLGSVVTRGDEVSLPAYFDFGPAGARWARDVPVDVAELETGRLFDLAFLARVLGGLIAVLVGVESVGAGRARGTFQAWAALGTSARVAVLGRILGAWMAVLAGLFLVLAAAVVVGGLERPAEASAITRLIARIALPIALYSGALIAVGAAASAWARHQSTAIVIGVALWLGASLMAPQAVALASRAFFTDRLRAVMETQRDDTFAGNVLAGEEAMGDAVVQHVGQASPEETVRAITALRPQLEAIWQTHAQRARSAATAIDRSWRDERHRQSRFEAGASLLTPAGALDQAMAELAGTGRAMTAGWLEAVESEQASLNTWLFDDRPRLTVRVPSSDGRQLLAFNRRDLPRWTDRPAFSQPAVAAPDNWRAASAALLALAAHLALAVAAVALAANRATRPR